MGNFKYMTNRQLENKEGKLTGKIRAFVRNDSERAEGDYKCPECMHEGKINQAFKRPFSLKCEGCGILLKVPKLKDQIKKEKKREAKE